MGFFDKVKHFAGGHGVKVVHTIIEKQDPAVVSLPVGDTVVKGKFKVQSQNACEVLSMKASFVMELVHPDGREESVVLGEDVFPAPNCSRSDEMLKYPHSMAAGAEVEDFFIISMNKDISTALKEKGIALEKARFFVKTMVDVKGSPFDPEAKNAINVVA